MTRGVRSALITVLAALCLALWQLPAQAASLDQLTPYLSAQYFTWSESSDGRRLLKERGPLFAGGLLFDVAIPVAAPASLTVRGRNELFGGFISYDGQTQSPQPVPVQTEVSYLGTRHDLDLGCRYSPGAWSLEPFGGLGYRWWLRGLQDTTSADGSAVSGYTEYWQTAYLRMGGRGSLRISTGATWFAEAGAKYPFYTSNSVDHVIGSGMTTFRPDGTWSGFAEAGVNYRRLRVAFSYEGFRYGASPLVRVGTKLFFQPDSSSDLVGLNVGWSF